MTCMVHGCAHGVSPGLLHGCATVQYVINMRVLNMWVVGIRLYAVCVVLLCASIAFCLFV